MVLSVIWSSPYQGGPHDLLPHQQYQLLGSLIAYTQQPPTSALPSAGNSKSGMKAVRSNKSGTMSLEEALNVLLLGYVKGGSGGSGELCT